MFQDPVKSDQSRTQRRGAGKDSRKVFQQSQLVKENIVAALPSGLPGVEGHGSGILGIFPLKAREDCSDCVVTVERAGKILIWSGPDRQPRLLCDLSGDLEKTAFHPGTLRLAAADRRAVHLVDLGQCAEQEPFTRVKSTVTALEFNPDGRSLLIGTGSGVLYRWRFVDYALAESIQQRDKSLERYAGHGTVVSTVAYHPHGRAFFSGDWNGVLLAWLAYDADAHKGFYDENLFGPRFFSDLSINKRGGRQDVEVVEQMVVSEDGQLLALGFQSGKVEIWKVRGFKRIGTVTAHKGRIAALALGPESSYLATAGRDGYLRIWFLEFDADKKEYFPLLRQEEEQEDVETMAFIDPALIWAGTAAGRLLHIKVEENAAVSGSGEGE